MKSYAVPERVIGKILEEKAKEHRDKVLAYMGERRLTYAQLNDLSNRLANSFQKLGIKKGDKLAILLPNCLEYLVVTFGSAKCGVTEVPINTSYKGYILEYVINQSEASTLIIDQRYLDRVKILQDKLSNLKRIIVRTEGEALEEVEGLKFPVVAFDSLLKGSPQKPDILVKTGDPLAIIYTSGTTGPSKGCILPHGALYAFGARYVKYCQVGPDDIIYDSLAWFHVNGHCIATVGALLAGASLVMAEWFHASTFWDEIRRYKSTIFHFAGGMLPALLAQPERPNEKDHTLTRAFGVPAPQVLRDEWRRRFGDMAIVEAVGSTETTTFIFERMGEPRPPGSCGKAIDDFDVALVDEDDYPVPVGKVGEFVCRPKEPFSMFSGYYNMPEATLRAFRNLWYHTGDAGYMDEDSYFHFVDRMKDAIRRKGENISSFEIEKIVCANPDVEDCAAIAVKDAVMTEDQVKICVVLKKGHELTHEELLHWCDERMPYFWVPTYIEFREALPRTETEKVAKYKLREEGITENTWDRDKAGIKIKREK